MTRLKIFFHDNCFDGATSAALFGTFYRAHVAAAATIELQAVQHKRGDPFAGYAIDGDDNACVDFRFSPDPRMTWWFDHHISAFQPAELEQVFAADHSGRKFFDPTARSCAMFEARVLEKEFGYRPPDDGGVWPELLRWADIIDGAQFESARVAVELAEPALHIMTWLEHNPDRELGYRLIRELGVRPLAELATEPWIAEPLAPVLEEHRHNIELIQRRAMCEGDVVWFDLGDDGVAAHNKFIAYMLFPKALYTIGVTRSPQRVKVSVGFNPWADRPRRHNIARICERFGGGGHPVVGAVSLGPDKLERAREIAQLIRTELMSDPAP